MIFYLFGLGTLYYFYQNGSLAAGFTSIGMKSVDISSLADIDPSDDKSNYTHTYDSFFKAASDKSNIPYALMKAHALRESALNSGAYHFDNISRGASYGIMQVEYLKGRDMYSGYGYTDDQLVDGSPLYDLTINCDLASKIIRNNLSRFPTLRDAINSYNTGKSEKDRPAPNNYVNDVLKYYSEIVGHQVS